MRVAAATTHVGTFFFLDAVCQWHQPFLRTICFQTWQPFCRIDPWQFPFAGHKFLYKPHLTSVQAFSCSSSSSCVGPLLAILQIPPPWHECRLLPQLGPWSLRPEGGIACPLGLAPYFGPAKGTGNRFGWVLGDGGGKERCSSMTWVP